MPGQLYEQKPPLVESRAMGRCCGYPDVGVIRHRREKPQFVGGALGLKHAQTGFRPPKYPVDLCCLKNKFVFERKREIRPTMQSGPTDSAIQRLRQSGLRVSRPQG